MDDDKSEVRINALKVSLVKTKSFVCVCMCICMHVFVCMCAQSYIPLYLHICTDLTTAKFLIHSIPNQSTNFPEHLTLCSKKKKNFFLSITVTINIKLLYANIKLEELFRQKLKYLYQIFMFDRHQLPQCIFVFLMHSGSFN